MKPAHRELREPWQGVHHPKLQAAVERLELAARLYAANQLEDAWEPRRQSELLQAAIEYTTALYAARRIRFAKLPGRRR
jgi:hypothetical protein